MAQENEDVSSKFSTLNVNAMEFVPSFCMDEPDEQPQPSPVKAQPAAPAAAPEAPVAEQPAADTNSAPASSTISSPNNGESVAAASSHS